MYLQPVFNRGRIRVGAVSEVLFQRELCLSSGTQITEEDFERATNVIRNCYKALIK